MNDTVVINIFLTKVTIHTLIKVGRFSRVNIIKFDLLLFNGMSVVSPEEVKILRHERRFLIKY